MGKIASILMHPHGKGAFLMRMSLKCKHIGRIRVLDVGCGNNSVESIKYWLPDCYYVGIDVDDYNLKQDLKNKMEEYHVVKPEDFSKEIEKFKNSIDVVISSHNIEHCNEPYEVLENMTASLKVGGGYFMAFPSEESINFPRREGTLNFYDDETHQFVPRWEEIIYKLETCGINIWFSAKNYRPFLDRVRGMLNERSSARLKKRLAGTWAYYGFESIIWGIKT